MTGTKTTFAITLEYAASIIALVAIFKSFFGHYLGTLEGLNGLILKFGYKGDKTKVSLGKLNTISMIFIMAKYRGRLDNVFVTVIGLLTILNIVYKLF